MLSYFNKLLFIAGFFIFVSQAIAGRESFETLQVTGANLNEALRSVLVVATKKYIKMDPNIRDAILNEEVLPKAAQFIFSYKVVNGNPNAGFVEVSAEVDLGTLRSMFGFNAGSMGNAAAAKPKVLFLVKGLNGGAPWEGVEYKDAEVVLDQIIENSARNDFLHRNFNVQQRFERTMLNLGNIGEISAKEVLQVFANNSQAQYVIAFESKLDEYTNDEGQKLGQHLFLKGTLFDNKQNIILASFQTHMPLAAGDRAIISHSVDEKIKDQVAMLLLNIFIQAGKASSSVREIQDSAIILRVVNASHFQAINELRMAINELKTVESIVEYRVKQGEFDFKVGTNLSMAALEREIQRLNLENYTVTLIPAKKSPDNVRMISVKLAANKKDK